MHFRSKNKCDCQRPRDCEEESKEPTWVGITRKQVFPKGRGNEVASEKPHEKRSQLQISVTPRSTNFSSNFASQMKTLDLYPPHLSLHSALERPETSSENQERRWRRQEKREIEHAPSTNTKTS